MNGLDLKIESNKIYALDRGIVICEIDFPELRPGVCTITHTYVDKSLAGGGIGGKLVELAIAQVKAQGKSIDATCSYAEAWMDKHNVR